MQHTDKMREEFEAWHREKFKDRLQNGQPTRDMHNGKYAERYTSQVEQERWEIWQASRASVVIDLPQPMNAPPYASYEGGWNDMRGEAIDAIDAAGVTVRG